MNKVPSGIEPLEALLCLITGCDLEEKDHFEFVLGVELQK